MNVSSMKYLVFILILAASISQPARGQQKLGVAEAILLAEDLSPELNRAKTNAQLIRAERWSSFGLDNIDVSHIREGIPNGGSGFGEQNWHISTSFKFPLSAISHWKGINQQTTAAEFAFESERLNVRSAVKMAYAELLFAQEMRHLREQEVDLALTLSEVVAGKVEVGESAKLDLMKVELQVSAALNAKLEADLAFELSRYELFRTIGIDPDQQRYDIVFPDTMVFKQLTLAQSDVLASLSTHPDVLSMAWEIESAKTNLNVSRYNLIPDLKIGYWPQDFGSGYRAYGVEVGLRFTLPFLGSSRTEREKARIMLQDTDFKSHQQRLDLKKEAESAWHGFETARNKVIQYVQTNSSRAEELLQLTREGYQLGQLDLLTVLDTQRTYLSIQSGYYQSLKDYYLRSIEIERLIGRELVFLTE